ncbi:MAG: bifunctional DNA primase/polymerase [Xanthomonadales bacterium]|nr:bifunctional DNA primase/polymerase [Xanthomonadales bacterium]
MSLDLFIDTEPSCPMPDFPDYDTAPVVKRDFLSDIPQARPDCDKAALEYIDAGLSVVPCALPGKYPATPWLTYQAEIADAAQVARWYGKNPSWGLGIVCGDVSGGLEVIDLDGGAFADEYDALIRANAPGLIERLVIEKSPSGGRHYAYRCSEHDGNSKIAQTLRELPGHKPGTDGLTTLLETRGQGGYIVTYPTRGYILLQGDWLHLPTITPAERSLLWSCAAMLDESDKAVKVEPAPKPQPKHEEPGNASEFHALMERHGWTKVKTSKGREDWRRPGKTDGISATWNYIEDSFYVFSSNAAPFKDNHRYTIKQVRQLLEPESVPQQDRPLTEKIYLTDMGNGRRFALRFSDQFKYNKALGWLNWNGSKWERNAEPQVMNAARHTVNAIFEEARDAHNPDDAKLASKWAVSSQSRGRLDALIYLASTEPSIHTPPEMFDIDPLLLNCKNGTVDLRTGAYYTHDSSRLLSKEVNTPYDVDATCPKWVDFLNRIMDGNTSLIKFIQRAVGYSLTGSTAEQCFFLNYGTGANGKSVFLETMRGLLNDYASAAEFSTFLATQNESIRNDIASLAGARFVSSSESGADKRLSEPIIKALTGGDTIAARFLFKEYFEFKPQFKVWMATNHKPVIKDTDHAIWRRVRLVPFNVTIPEKDRNPNLIAELRAEYSGILTWAVQGCLEWQRDGLGAPVEVVDATNAYRNEQDTFGAFIGLNCVVSESAAYSASKLHKLYCEVTGEKVTAREFNGMMTEHGFKQVHSRTGNVWQGIGPIEYESND